MKTIPIVNKYKNIPAPIKASFWFLVSSVIINGIRLLITPILTRILSEADYGIIGIYNAWRGTLNVVVTLSLSAGVYSNGLLDFKNDRNRFASSVLVLSSISTLLWYIIFLTLKDRIINITKLSDLQMTIMFLGFLVNPALGYWSAEQKFDYKYKYLSIIIIATALASQIIAIISVIYIDFDKANIVIVTSELINIFISSIIYGYILIRGKCSVKLKYWKYVLAFNLPLIPHYLSFIVLAQSDRIMIANIIGADKAGIYTLGYTAASILQIIYAAINSSLSPFTLKKMKEKRYKEIENIANYILIIYSIISSMVIGFAPEMIRMLAPPSYAEAVLVIPPVTIGLYFFVVAGFFTNIGFYHKKTLYIMFSTINAAIANLILNFIFIPKYGFIAAAYTTAIGYLLFMIFHYLIMKKIEKNNIYNIRFFILISSIFIVISISFMIFYKVLILRLIITCIIFGGMLVIRKNIEQNIRKIWNRS
jgi:O-antigen/teichoic acid export membrane protein